MRMRCDDRCGACCLLAPALDVTFSLFETCDGVTPCTVSSEGLRARCGMPDTSKIIALVSAVVIVVVVNFFK